MSNAPATKPEENKPVALVDRVVKYIPIGSDVAIELTIPLCQMMFCRPTKNGNAPAVADVIKFMKLCEAKRLNPYVGDAFFVGYDAKDGPQFSLITAVQSLYKRAEKHPSFDGLKAGLIVRRGNDFLDLDGEWCDEKDVVLGAWAILKRREHEQPYIARIKLSSYNKGRGLWNDMKEVMIVKCAKAKVLREAFPTENSGEMIIEEFGLGDILEGVFSRESEAPASEDQSTEAPVKKTRAQRVKEMAPKALDHKPTEPAFQKQEETRETVPVKSQESDKVALEPEPERQLPTQEEEAPQQEEPVNEEAAADEGPQGDSVGMEKFQERFAACKKRDDVMKLVHLAEGKSSPFMFWDEDERKRAVSMAEQKFITFQE